LLSLRDEGLSTYHQKHVTQGALGTFLRAVEDGRIPDGSVLIVEDLDRLSRAEVPSVVPQPNGDPASSMRPYPTRRTIGCAGPGLPDHQRGDHCCDRV
jgi:hypothetical protein